MARVFVSHASADLPIARRIRGWLDEDGHDAFLAGDPEHGIPLGDDWQARLHERLRWADAMVCVLTSAYTASAWCAAEVGIAQSRGLRLLPVRVEPDVHAPLLASTQQFELTTDGASALSGLTAALVRVVGDGWPDGRSPFPGLRPFDVDDRRVFFGRADEVSQLATTLRSPAHQAERAVLLVVGPSGCGKSSLVRAGLVPAMAADPHWLTVAPVVPGPQPLAALRRELAATARDLGIGWSLDDLDQLLGDRDLDRIADSLLLAGPGTRRTRLLIVIDQFEELLTQATPAHRAGFADVLRAALNGPVEIVATLRPEYLSQLQVDPDLGGIPTDVSMLRPLRRDALRDVIEGPADLAGIAVADDLVARLIADTDSGDALPLLAYTLEQLADGVERGGLLRTDRYERLGGVQAALARQADAALTKAVAKSGLTPEQVVRELLRLVTVDDHGRPTRWRVQRDGLPPATSAAFDAFVARRLLITDITDGTVELGVAHEAFLTAWPLLAKAVLADSAALRARRAIEQAASAWVEADHAAERLWERGQLAAAVADVGARSTDGPLRHRALTTDRVELSARARDFLLTSIRRDRRLRRRWVTVLSALLVAALIAAGIAIVQQQIAEDGRKLATARLLLTRAEAALGTDPRTALMLGEAAHQVHPDPGTRAGLANLLFNVRFSSVLEGHDGYVWDAAFAPDGRTLVTVGADRRMILWDVADRSGPRLLDALPTEHTDEVLSVAFAPDGRTIATGSADHTVRLWDVTDRARPRGLGPPLVAHTGRVWSVAFAPDGRTLATGGDDRTVLLWDVTDPAQARRLGPPLAAHTDYVYSVAFSPDGRHLATGSADRTVLLWDLTDRALPRSLGPPLTDHTGLVWSVAFTPDGRHLASASSDGTVLLWDLTDPTQPRRTGPPLTGHTGAVLSVAITPDGRTLATGGGDHTVRLWDITDPAKPQSLDHPLIGHTDAVLSVRFGPDGRLATTSWDRTALLWDLADPTQPRRLDTPLTGHTDRVLSMAVSPDGRTLATAGADQTLRLWDLADPTRPRPLGAPLTDHTAEVISVAYSPDGRTLATADLDQTVLLWDLTDPTRPRRLGPLDAPGRRVAFALDRPTLATFDADRTVLLWDLTDPAKPRRLGDPLIGHASAVLSAAFTPDGRTMVTADLLGTILLWDLTDPTRPRRLGEPLTGPTRAVVATAFSPDGALLAAAGGDRTVLLWDVTDPAQPRRIGRPLTGYDSDVETVAFAPDGDTLATAGRDRSVLLWDVTDPAQPRRLGDPLEGHTEAVSSLAFTSDGRTLATAGWDRQVLLWDFTNPNRLRADALEQACSITRRGLTPDEWVAYVPALPYANACAR